MSVTTSALGRAPAGAQSNPLLTLALLGALTLAPALSLANSRWVERLEIVPWLTVLALLVGLGAARTRFPGALLHPMALGLGAGLAAWGVASSLAAPTTQAQIELLGRRILTWLSIVGAGGVGTDNLLFLLLLAVLGWVVGYFGAFSVFRAATPWWAIVTSGTALLVNAAYRGRADGYLTLYLIAALALVADLSLTAQRRTWQSQGLAYRRGVSGWVAPLGIGLAAALVAIATALPTTLPTREALERVRSAAQESSRPLGEAQAELQRLFGGVTGNVREASSGFASTMTLQGEFRLSPELVADVSSPRPRYWRAVTYEEYTGRGWKATSTAEARSLVPNENHPSAYERRIDLVQKVTRRANRGEAILAAAQPRSLDIGAAAEYPAGVGGNPLALDLTSTLRSPRVALPGVTYTVTSAISVAEEADLRAAGTRYPEAVLAHYGRLPPVPERVRALARQLAPPSMTPYERASAIERYLRGLRYELVVPVPPPDRDGVDFFLFDSQTGYCDYFATAMVVMLRSVGVPARVASGYAVGERDAAAGLWRVRDANAHSWVEVYMPRYGWIEFEPSPIRSLSTRGDPTQAGPTPTAAVQPPPPRPPEAARPPEQSTPAASPRVPTPPDSSAPRTWLADVPWTTILFVTVGLAALAGAGRLAWGWGIDGLPAPEAGYARMARLAWLTGRGARAHETPHEFARGLGAAVPAAAAAARTLADAFVGSRFARSGEADAGALDRAWRVARRAILASLVRRSRAGV